MASRLDGIRHLLPSKSAKLIVGVVIVGVIVLSGVVGPLFTLPPLESAYGRMQSPNSTNLMGTTSLGYDVLGQLTVGTAGTLYVGIVGGVVALVLSVFFGVLAGYFGGWIDEALTIVTNIMLVIPGLPLVMIIAAYVQGAEGLGDFARSSTLIAIILGITGWAGSAIVLRAQSRSLRTLEYVAASRVAGEGGMKIIFVEILPNLLPITAAQFIFGIMAAVLGEAGLSYLGLGPTGSVTLGTMLNDAQTGQAVGASAWWWFLPPGILIALLGTGLALVNFSIDEIVNPKLRLAPKAARQQRKATKEGAVAGGSLA